MNLVEYVLTAITNLDPSLDSEIAEHYGDDWRNQLKDYKAVSIADRYTTKALRKLARKHKIKGRSKLRTEQQLIDALQNAGVEL